jgi:hypothetical protein
MIYYVEGLMMQKLIKDINKYFDDIYDNIEKEGCCINKSDVNVLQFASIMKKDESIICKMFGSCDFFKISKNDYGVQIEHIGNDYVNTVLCKNGKIYDEECFTCWFNSLSLGFADLIIHFEDKYVMDVVREKNIVLYDFENGNVEIEDYFVKRFEEIGEQVDIVKNKVECIEIYNEKVGNKDSLMLSDGSILQSYYEDIETPYGVYVVNGFAIETVLGIYKYIDSPVQCIVYEKHNDKINDVKEDVIYGFLDCFDDSEKFVSSYNV